MDPVTVALLVVVAGSVGAFAMAMCVAAAQADRPRRRPPVSEPVPCAVEVYCCSASMFKVTEMTEPRKGGDFLLRCGHCKRDVCLVLAPQEVTR